MAVRNDSFAEPTFDDPKMMQATSKPCKKHNAAIGEGCWNIMTDSSDYALKAVCNKRARAVGFNGRISTNSLNSGSKRRR